MGARSLNFTVVSLNLPIIDYQLDLIIIDKISKLKKLIINCYKDNKKNGSNFS